MGLHYYFVCLTCNEIYDMDKAHHAERFLPYLINHHRKHQFIATSEFGIERNYLEPETVEVVTEENGKEYLHAQYLSFNLNKPKEIDCLEEPFYSQFEKWEKPRKTK